jgi:putative LysE/RhtB family amino acid efflux pump
LGVGATAAARPASLARRPRLTELIEFLLKGLFIGLIVGVPIGPVGVLCLQRTVSNGARIGLASGLGASMSNALYGAVAAFGVHFVASFLSEHHRALEIFGGLVVAGFGARLLFEKPPAAPESAEPQGGLSAFWTAFVLSMLTPSSLFFLLAAVAAAGVGRPSAHPIHAALLVAGLFAGSVSWWLAISASGRYLRRRLASRLRMLEGAAGAAMIAAGLGVAVARLLE